MARPLSIIIPHFSKQESLKQVFNELQLQINPDDEILIIDDYSPGGVPDFDCLCTKVIYPPKKLTPHIYRLNTLRNLGLQHASHDPCIILDPDCIPNPHFLDNARKMYDPSVLFGGRIDRVKENGTLKTDLRARGGSRWTSNPTEIHGGCMMFSKERTRLVGWFDEGFNGAWGAEEHDFTSRCHHSGIRLRYSEKLLVTHQWHPPVSREGYERNRARWIESHAAHAENLNYVSPYKPTIVALIITKMHPRYIDQVMRSLFRHNVPLKVCLVNNGDQSKEQLRALQPWIGRWAVDYVNYKTQKPLSNIQTDAIKFYAAKGYKYLVSLNDDTTPLTDSFTTIISETGNHNPHYMTIKLNKVYEPNIGDKKHGT